MKLFYNLVQIQTGFAINAEESSKNFGTEIACSDKLVTKFKAYTCYWISYTKDGTQDTVPPKQLSGKENIEINLDSNNNLAVRMGKVIHSYDTIERFDDP